MDIHDKVAIVTGGGSGMGAATARLLSRKGAKVAILDINEASAQSVAEEIGGLAIVCDVASDDEAQNAFTKIQDELGSVRICINCAGVAPAQRIVGREGPMPLANFEKIIRINLIATFNILRLAAAVMTKLEPLPEHQERGVIVNTASIAAFEGQIGQAAYSASKGGVCSLTLPAARELGDFNVRVMTIAPGLIQTPMLEGLPSEVQDKLGQQIPFPKRFGRAEEFALLVEHIILNPYLNGEVIRLDGGLRMQAR
jgi:NAD(P)-dependent dehydrogenase (short-subunit alcohol dehydrogenase family)